MELARADRIFLRTIHVAGIVTPWVTGIGTKIVLDLRGEPTTDWADLFEPVMILVILWAGAWFYSPFGLLAWSGRRLLEQRWALSRRCSRTEWRILLYAAFGVGFGGAVATFLPMFRELDILLLLFAYWFPPFLGTCMALGIACGAAVVGLRRAREARISARGGPPAS